MVAFRFHINMTDPVFISKNTLQEYCQGRKLPLPSYKTIRVGGSDHAPTWKSTVTIYDGRQFEGDIGPIKSRAEGLAAFNAISALNHTKISEIDRKVPEISKQIMMPPKTALLVDVENLPKFIDELPLNINNLTVYAFIGRHHCLVDKKFPPGTIKVISPSTRPDGTDTCMQVYTGALLSKEVYDTYLIATRDHYGSALVEMIMSNDLFWPPKSARLVTQISQLWSD